MISLSVRLVEEKGRTGLRVRERERERESGRALCWVKYPNDQNTSKSSTAGQSNIQYAENLAHLEKIYF